MNSKRSEKAAAVIELEPTFVKLKVSQLKKGKISDIENLESALPIGSEIYSGGKISSESLRELFKILRGYGKIIQGYGIEACLLAVGPELFSAQNRVFLMDRLKRLDGMKPKLYGTDLRNALVCHEVIQSDALSVESGSGSAVIAVIGAGSICISVFENGKAALSLAFPSGPLKLSHTFSGFQNISDLSCAAEEYLGNMFGRSELRMFHGDKPRLILAGHGIKRIASLCGTEKDTRKAKPEKISGLFERIRDLPSDKIGMSFNLPEESAKRLYFSLVIVQSLMETVSPEAVLFSETDLAGALMRQTLLSKERNAFLRHVREGAAACAGRFASNNGCSREHSEFVRKLSCRIFDKIQREFAMGKENRLLLELSAVLRGCGRPAENGGIYGITEEELGMLRAVAAREEELSGQEPHNETELTVSRLSAVLALADSLDRSGRQKLADIRIKLVKGGLKITAESRENTALEKWAFGVCAPRFTKAFGLVPELAIKFADSVQ